MKYSTWLSPVGGDVFVSTQPWAAKGAWFVKLKNNIVVIHGSDFEIVGRGTPSKTRLN